jgi:hypothetical protein
MQTLKGLFALAVLAGSAYLLVKLVPVLLSLLTFVACLALTLLWVGFLFGILRSVVKGKRRRRPEPRRSMYAYPRSLREQQRYEAQRRARRRWEIRRWHGDYLFKGSRR